MKIKYVPSISKRFSEYTEFIQDNFPELLDTEEPDLILTAGGDGTMLNVIQEYSEKNVIFLGKGLGNRNFLLNEFENDRQVIRSLLNDDRDLDEFEIQLINVEKNSADTKESDLLGAAVNDVVVGNTIMGYHEFILNTANYSFQDLHLLGSGVCISTPFGSTGYNYNNRGPVLPLDASSWAVTGIATNNTLNDIISQQELIISARDDSREPLFVFIDGLTKKIQIKETDEIYLRPGRTVRLGFLDRKKFLKKRNELKNPRNY
jgi:NAD+ kinase